MQQSIHPSPAARCDRMNFCWTSLILPENTTLPANYRWIWPSEPGHFTRIFLHKSTVKLRASRGEVICHSRNSSEWTWYTLTKRSSLPNVRVWIFCFSLLVLCKGSRIQQQIIYIWGNLKSLLLRILHIKSLLPRSDILHDGRISEGGVARTANKRVITTVYERTTDEFKVDKKKSNFNDYIMKNAGYLTPMESCPYVTKYLMWLKSDATRRSWSSEIIKRRKVKDRRLKAIPKFCVPAT